MMKELPPYQCVDYYAGHYNFDQDRMVSLFEHDAQEPVRGYYVGHGNNVRCWWHKDKDGREFWTPR
jgi:hypothetical protein